MDHKDSKFDFSPSELEMVCDKSFFFKKGQVLSKIKSQYTRIEEAIHKIDFPSLPFEMLTRGKISQGENYLGAPWVVLDAPAFFSGKDILAFRHIFLWGLNISTTLHVSGKYLDKVDFEAVLELTNPELMILTGEDPFIHHKDLSVYKPIRELSIEEMKGLKHLRISIFSDPNEWSENFEKSMRFTKELQKIII